MTPSLPPVPGPELGGECGPGPHLGLQGAGGQGLGRELEGQGAQGGLLHQGGVTGSAPPRPTWRRMAPALSSWLTVQAREAPRSPTSGRKVAKWLTSPAAPSTAVMLVQSTCLTATPSCLCRVKTTSGLGRPPVTAQTTVEDWDTVAPWGPTDTDTLLGPTLIKGV